jgi:hypothetical protein
VSTTIRTIGLADNRRTLSLDEFAIATVLEDGPAP